jgi:hypothetical protein
MSQDCESAFCNNVFINIFLKTIFYKFYIFGPKGYKFEVFSWEPKHQHPLKFITFSVES